MQGHFTLVLLQCESWWVGWVSELPTVNSHADTRDGLLDNLRWALDDELEVSPAELAATPGPPCGEWPLVTVG